MKRVGKVLGSVVACALILAMLAAAFLVGRTIYTALAAAPSAFTTALIGATGLVIGGFATVIYQRRGAVEDALREARTPMYEDFMTFFFRIFGAANHPEQAPDPGEQERFFAEFTRRAITLSSDRFLREWSGYRQKLAQGALQTVDPTRPNHMLMEFEKVLLAIRDDFGHRNRKIQPGDILRMWINDLPALPNKYP
jgi:hypothetical protein